MSTTAPRPFALHTNEAKSPSRLAEPAACPLCTAADDSLVEEIQCRRQDAVEHFFDRHYRTVLHIALRIVRDDGEAQDVVQDVFFQFIQNLELFDRAKGTPRTWLMAIAYHRSLDRRHYLNLRHFYDRVEIDPLKHGILANGNPAYFAPRLIGEEKVEGLLASLTDAQRNTIRLYCFDGLTFREISERSGETLSNTRHHYYRAIEKIRQHLVQEKTS